MTKPVIVLGMHKSGTTLVREMLHHSGIEMVEQENNLGYDKGNHYERKSTNDFNKVLLGCGGLNSLKVTTELDMSSVTDELKIEGRDLIEDIAKGKTSWGFKDPRNCLTYPYWKEIIVPHKLVCVFRSAKEVHSHYVKRHKFKLNRRVNALHAWYVYNQCILKAAKSAQGNDVIMIDYPKLMQGDEVFNALQDFIGAELSDKRNKSMRRSKPKNLMRFNWDCKRYQKKYGNDVGKLNDEIIEFCKNTNS